MAGIKSNLAKQTLVRYIREMNLKPGDRLPAQAELRQRLKMGTTSITTALYELQADKVIEIRDKVGVFVLDSGADGHIGRRIGLAINALEVSAFRCCMSNLIQHIFSQQGWQVIPFFTNNPQLFMKMEYHSFPGLKRSVEQKVIDALVTLEDFSDESISFFSSCKLPYLFIGALETKSSRIVIDMSAYLKNAFAKFADAGIQYPAIVTSEALKSQLESLYQNELQGFPKAGPPLTLTGNFITDGALAARQILELPPESRPDGIAFFDDTLASSFCAELFRRNGCCYLPRTAIVQNTQNPMDFAVKDPFNFYVDQKYIAKKAAAALSLLMNVNSEQVIHYTPEFIENTQALPEDTQGQNFEE